MFSIASIITMSVCIFMLSIFFSMGVNFRYAVKNIEGDVAITVFFDEKASEKDIKEIGKKIEAKSEVSKIKYVSADQAWKNFVDRYFNGDESAAPKDNPLNKSANYEVYLKDISHQKDVVSYIKGIKGVRTVRQSDKVAKTLSQFNKLLSVVSVVILAILIAIAIFLISNTIRTGITVRREEIAIMKLIGATDYLVRAPFIVEGVIIGLIGAVIPLGVLYFSYGKAITYIISRYRILSDFLSFVSVEDIFKVLLPLGLILGVGIGYIGSRLTCRRHLRV